MYIVSDFYCSLSRLCYNMNYMEEQNEVKVPKSTNRKLIGVLVVLGILIVGLVAMMVVLNSAQGSSEEEKFGAIDSVKLGDTVSEYMFDEYYRDGYDENEYNDLTIYLRDIMLNGDTKEDRLNARNYLSTVLYYAGHQEDAINLLNDELESGVDIEDQDRYFLLASLLNFYTDMGDLDGQKKTLQAIVSLPDDMVLSDQDWSETKKMFYNLMQEIEDGENE